jgi:hypothetical protein
MSDFLKSLSSFPDFHALKGADEKRIQAAERELGVVFSQDYREYLSEFGLMDVNGHEFTGICDSPRLNVVEVTKSDRQYISGIPSNWYVLEEAYIDGIIIWQDENGSVYFSAPNRKPYKLADSMIGYLKG